MSNKKTIQSYFIGYSRIRLFVFSSLVMLSALGCATVPTVKFLGLGAPTAGNAGIDDLNKACNDQFSGSRMCSSSEILNSAVIEIFSSSPWVRPDIVGVDGNGIAVDASGLAFEPQKLSCDGWKNGAGFFGLALIPSGGFNILACDQTRNVACCGFDN